MCNPRKVMIHLSRCIEEAWRRSVEQCVTAEGEVNELGRIRADIRLDEEMGGTALEMLERVIAEGFEGADPWDEMEPGRYCRDLGEVSLTFEAATGQLSVEAQLTEQVAVEAREAAQVCGFTMGEVAAKAVGQYYDDGWGGRTKEKAEQEAKEKTEEKLQEALEALHREQNPEAFAAAESEARAAAEKQAERNLQAAQTQVRIALQDRLCGILANAEERVRHVMNRAVGEAYRLSLISLVEANGGRILTDEKTGSVINMEMEIY